MQDFLTSLETIVGASQVLSGQAARDKYDQGWLPQYRGRSLAVVRPSSTKEVSQVLSLASQHGVPVIPMGGNTGLTGATMASPGDTSLILSLERMNRICGINPASRTMQVQAGVVLDDARAAAEVHKLCFPLVFGARGSCMIGGNLSTNAGGSNVLRYGTARDMCLGLEVVLADGRVVNLMSNLRKDNTGYDLKNLFIGAEGTLGVITEAVLKLSPLPTGYATAMVAMNNLPDALNLLDLLDRASDGCVEAFEFMPAIYCDLLSVALPDLQPVFATVPPVTILVELGSAAKNSLTDLVDLLQTTLMQEIEAGRVSDAVVAQSETQRVEFWQRRESTFAVTDLKGPTLDTDVALPQDKLHEFIERANATVSEISPNCEPIYIAHLGDGNVHYSLWLNSEIDNHTLHSQIIETIEDIVADLGGSFSAEHGIGLMKKSTMARRKDPVALALMRDIKQTLDPKGIMNPGKLLPDSD